VVDGIEIMKVEVQFE